MTTEEIRRLTDRLSHQNFVARKTLREAKEASRLQRRHVKHTVEAQALLQTVAERVQEQVHGQISRVVSKCLKAVFDDPYQFRIIFEKKRGKTEARMVFVRKGLILNPTEECGLGPVDVAAFALRLACLVLQKPALDRVLILDEPFKFVSERKDYRERVGQLLTTLAVEMKVQFVIVTHDQILEVGKVIDIS
jgi:DNA repair exonuclease SbcCD ATPase subunit